jgi:hypothetical protein
VNKVNNFKKPFIYTKDQSEEELIAKIKESDIINEFNDEKLKQRQFDALELFVNKVKSKNENIEVIFVLMPINPMLLSELNKENLSGYYERIYEISSENNIEIFDFEKSYDKTEFTDLTHLNKNGRENFASILSKEL